MLKIRNAQKEDAKEIYRLINELAIYEKLEDEVIATVKDLEESIFEKKQAKVILAELDSKIVGYALYFTSYSTFLGKAGIYLEDLFVEPMHRGEGIGKKLLRELAKIAVENNYGRLEWAVLDWNTPAIDFYKSIGAKAMNGWITKRLTGEELENLAK